MFPPRQAGAPHEHEPDGEPEGHRSRRAGRRSIWAVGALVVGFLISRQAGAGGSGIVGEFDSSAWFLSAGVAAIAGLLLRGRACRVFLLLAVVALGAGRYRACILEHRADALGPWVESQSPSRGDPVIIALSGLVLRTPAATGTPAGALAEHFRSERSWVFEFEARTLETAARHGDGIPGEVNVSGIIRVRLGADGGRDVARAADGQPIRAGDRVRIQGLAEPIAPALNPGEPDRRALAAMEGLACTIRVPSELLVHRLEPEGGVGRARTQAIRLIDSLRAHARSVLETALDRDEDDAPDVPVSGDDAPSPSGLSDQTQADAPAPQHSAPENLDKVVRSHREATALLGAMLLGIDDGAGRGGDRQSLGEITGAFTRLGLTHLVAISGLNMVFLAGLGLFVLRLTGDRGAFEPLAVAALVGVYLLVLPAQAPALRGGVMVLVFLLAEALGRRHDRLTVLGWIAIALLWLRPLDAFSPGFQLSFSIVAALIWLGERFHQRLFGVPIRGVAGVAIPAGRRARFERLGLRTRLAIVGLIDASKRALSSSILAWIVASPIVAYHMGIASPLAVLTTLVVAPVCAAVLWVGYIVLLAGSCWSGAAAALGPALNFAGESLVWIVHVLDGLPGASVRVPALSLGLSIAILILAVHWVRRGHARSVTTWAATAIVLAWLGVAWRPAKDPAVAVRIDTLAVGDGACHLVRVGGASMLIDCGSGSPGAGLRLIPQALRTLGATHVETVAITHADIRHFGALLDAAAPLGVRRVLVPAEFLRAARRGLERPGLSSVADRAAGALVFGLERRRIEILTLDRGDQWPIGGAVLRVLWPDEHGGSESLAHRAGPGVHSLVMRLSVTSDSGGHSVLFTGGATAEALSALEAMEPHLRADVLDLPDHGSYSDDAVRLIKRAPARVLIRSGGDRVPADRLKERAHKDVPGAAWLDTATDGALRVEVLRNGTIRTRRFSDRGPSPP